MTDEEKKEILRADGTATVNPALFVKDLSGFDLTSYSSAPMRQYPTWPTPPCRRRPLKA